jgi:hypothetical protein
VSLPVLPSPQSVSPADLADYGASIVAWADQTDSVTEVREATSKWAAITEYVRRTSRDGIAEAEAVLRRLEVRVGKLLGPAEVGGRGKVSTTSDTFSRDERSDLRALADHEDVVEQVIAESTDQSPPSRNKVLGAIRDSKPSSPRRSPLTEAAERAGWDLRKATERIERIVADDRFTANKQQVAAYLNSHLLYTIEACQGLVSQL